MKGSGDIESDESTRLLGVDKGNSLVPEEYVGALQEEAPPSSSSSSSSISTTKILVATASLAAACIVLAFSGNSAVGTGLSAMNFQAMSATTDGMVHYFSSNFYFV